MVYKLKQNGMKRLMTAGQTKVDYLSKDEKEWREIKRAT